MSETGWRGAWVAALAAVLGGAGALWQAVTLSLEPMELGRSADDRPSWAERMLALRDDPNLGPFHLAYLESLLRAADMRVSARIAKDEQ